MRCAGHVARMGAKRLAYKISIRNLKGKRPLGRLRHRWEYIKIDRIKIRLEGGLN
jgi:hypothetical protein